MGFVVGKLPCPRQPWRGSLPATHARPPGSPPNSPKIAPPKNVTFSPTLFPHKSFRCNTYGSPYNCCKQKTYRKPNSFRCNTYKKPGGSLHLLPALFTRSLRSLTKECFTIPLQSNASALFLKTAGSYSPAHAPRNKMNHAANASSPTDFLVFIFQLLTDHWKLITLPPVAALSPGCYDLVFHVPY
jgi:hypothetical protein